MALKHQTIYSSLPVQSYMIQMVKKPILDSVPIIFAKDATKIRKLRATVELWRALKALAHLPAPTIENTWHPNTHNLIELRDWIVSRIRLSGNRNAFIEILFNLAIIIYDFDPPWRWIMDSVKDKAFKMDWKPRGFGDDWSDGYNWWLEDEKKVGEE